MSTWAKCSDALPPIGKPVIVAWEQTQSIQACVCHSAVMRGNGCCNNEWEWFDYNTEELYEWSDEPTHWMPWPEFKPGTTKKQRKSRDLEVCANALEPGARLVRNVTAEEIRDLCLWVREMDRRMISIDELQPVSF